MTPYEAAARNALLLRTMPQLISDWEVTEATPHSLELAMVRGWIMDELARRNPKAFDAWIDSDDCVSASPREFFL